MPATILMPNGRLDTSAAPAFERDMVTATQSDSVSLLIDLRELVYVSSAGLRVILMAAKRVRAKGGRIALCGLQPQVAEVFEISGFGAIVPIHADRESALAALR
jgi:anti-sigma B factor antagonist/stage II sporulation protein AA (anti-sigma F factor antagonist)